MTSLKPNLERVKQRREEVMKAALRSKRFTSAQLTREASTFILFCLALERIRTKKEITKGRD
ncbi:MAG: hypothetical protein KAS63_06095 [Candidatus Heimdallarchaeota archaeon]|nr:hypothetical protein [Candidatus Heimdallarchaeota archaeon]MCK4954912.1 hypothetical protein [Candidatus Heimdallarchaeota archaeon]